MRALRQRRIVARPGPTRREPRRIGDDHADPPQRQCAHRQARRGGFTGDVHISGYFERGAPSRLAGAVVTFGPGARTPWKVNPLGQTLVVTSGVGWTQGEGEDVVEIRAGDMVWCPPGQRHWDGATPEHALTYVALHEGGVQFGARVTDEEYRQGPPPPA